MKNRISKVFMIAGALLTFGTAGDSDVGILSFEGALIKVSVGIIVFGAGVLLRNTTSAKT